MDGCRGIHNWTSPAKGDLGFIAAVLVMMVLGVIYRLEYITSSLHHDEAYTYVAFAHSFFSAISDYHLPNNHVFHSILVFFSTSIFGIEPWAVRLPAFTAGVLLIPAVYWLAKRIYDRWTALGAALLVAWLPMLIDYSTNARGYTLLALITLLCFTLGDIVRKERNSFAWVLIGLLSALGFFTLPVMLLPFGILFVWLFISNQVEGSGPYHSRLDFFLHWSAAGFGAAILTLLFYTPILVYSGSQKLFANDFVASVPWRDLLATLAYRFTETWAEWTYRLPVWAGILIALGFILSLVFHRQLSNLRVPLQGTALLWIVVVILVQRPNAWPKVWLFLLPLVLIWAAAGTIGLLAKVQLSILGGLPLVGLIIGLAMLGGVIKAAWLVPQLPAAWAAQGDEEQAVLFVLSQLQDDNLIIVSPPDDASVWYYSKLHHIPDALFDLRNPASGRYLVMVDPAEGQTPASVIAERGPDTTPPDAGACILLSSFGKMQVFGCPAR